MMTASSDSAASPMSTASSVPTESSVPATSLAQAVPSVTNSDPPPQTPSAPDHYRDTYPAPATSGGGNTSVGTQVQLNSEYGIGARAYSNMRLSAITIPEGARYIGDGAFLSNSLTSIVIPPSVRSIGSQAFIGNALTSITIGENVSLQYDSFRYRFLDFYRMNHYMAGTYVLKAGQWVFKGQ
jgi:hypothetical protein